MKDDDLKRLRTASRHFAFAAVTMAALLLVFVAAMLVEESGDSGSDSPAIFLLRTTYLMPALFYLWALLALHCTWPSVCAMGCRTRSDPPRAQINM